MNDEELKKKAKAYADEYFDDYRMTVGDLENAYIAGAKENGIVWHDLRKNPKDLPENEVDVLIAFVNETARGREILTANDRYLSDDKLWYYDGEGKDIVAWCEKPRFEE